MTERKLSAPRLKTKEALFALSGNQCAVPECESPLFMDGKIVGKIAHIHAQSAGGPRYDPNLSDEEVHGLANLILLCGPHHDIIDANATQFDAATLRKMKADHEARDVTAPNDLFKRLIDALAPDVPDNWWERPSAPRFRLNPASHRPKDADWTFEINIDQVTGSDIGRLRYAYRLGPGELIFKDPRLMQDRKWRLDKLTVQPRGGPLELVLTFWWDGAERTTTYRWQKEADFQSVANDTVLTYA